MFAAFALLDNAAPGLWDFLTAFGVVATPIGIGLAIAVHALGKKLVLLLAGLTGLTGLSTPGKAS